MMDQSSGSNFARVIDLAQYRERQELAKRQDRVAHYTALGCYHHQENIPSWFVNSANLGPRWMQFYEEFPNQIRQDIHAGGFLEFLAKGGIMPLVVTSFQSYPTGL
jgi:hypothetical protein